MWTYSQTTEATEYRDPPSMTRARMDSRLGELQQRDVELREEYERMERMEATRIETAPTLAERTALNRMMADVERKLGKQDKKDREWDDDENR